MKTAVFIFDAITQVVLTPETDTDKRVCELIEKGTTGTMRGSVYECHGGWIRFKQSRDEDAFYIRPATVNSMSDNESLIVRVAAKDAAEV